MIIIIGLLFTLRNMAFFSDFQYGFKSSQATADCLTVLCGRIVMDFNWSGTTGIVAVDISKAFDRIWHACVLFRLKSYGISGWMFGWISFLSL